jgi:hypothetical protein
MGGIPDRSLERGRRSSNYSVKRHLDLHFYKAVDKSHGAPIDGSASSPNFKYHIRSGLLLLNSDEQIKINVLKHRNASARSSRGLPNESERVFSLSIVPIENANLEYCKS